MQKTSREGRNLAVAQDRWWFYRFFPTSPGKQHKDNSGQGVRTTKKDPNKNIVKFILEICLFKQIDKDEAEEIQLAFCVSFAESFLFCVFGGVGTEVERS